jgi:hypothetical protein
MRFHGQRRTGSDTLNAALPSLRPEEHICVSPDGLLSSVRWSKNVGLKGSPVNIAPRAAKAKEKPAGLSRRV